jgi:hypothetical protein
MQLSDELAKIIDEISDAVADLLPKSSCLAAVVSWLPAMESETLTQWLSMPVCLIT